VKSILKIVLGILMLSSLSFAGNLVNSVSFNKNLNSAGLVNSIASILADQLGQNKNFGNVSDTPIAIASVVNLENFSDAGNFGNVISEALIHEMQTRGYKIVDFKTMSTIRVGEKGDFVFSRALEDLKKKQNINYVLTGTFTKYGDGVSINSRIIDLETNVVKSSAQAFAPIGLVNRINGVVRKNVIVKYVKTAPTVNVNTITLK